MEILVITSMLVVIIYQGVFIYIQKKNYDLLIGDLLNRVMSRNYETFVQGQVVMQPKNLTVDEIAAMQEERGIPV